MKLFRQERLLLNKCNLRIKLTPNNEVFYLICDNYDYEVKLQSARFELTKIKMNPGIINDHIMALMKSIARYPIRQSEIKTFSIPQSNMQTVKESMFSGQVPRRLLISFQDSQALSGNVEKNPLNFQHFNLNYLCAHMDHSHTDWSMCAQNTNCVRRIPIMHTQNTKSTTDTRLYQWSFRQSL